MVGTKLFPTLLFVFLVRGDTSSLEFDMNEGLCAEVRHIPGLGNHGRVGAGEIKTIHESVVDTFARDVLDAAVPNDLRYEIHV